MGNFGMWAKHNLGRITDVLDENVYTIIYRDMSEGLPRNHFTISIFLDKNIKRGL